MADGTVYLLHFDTPYPAGMRPGHYLGWTEDLDDRVAAHRAGLGARLMAVIADAGIGFVVARTWLGDRNFERRLKKRHMHRRLCPICTPNAGVGRGRWRRR